MVKFVCNKIVRSKSLERMAKADITAHIKKLKPEEMLPALKAKLVEEALEVQEANERSEIILEVVDVLEVIDSLLKNYGISHEEIAAAKKEVFAERGGFDEGNFLESFEMAEDNPRISHFRATPEKYKEE